MGHTYEIIKYKKLKYVSKPHKNGTYSILTTQHFKNQTFFSTVWLLQVQALQK